MNFEISNDTFAKLYSNGDLRKVKVADEEIIMRFYFAVRDKEWLNVPYTLSDFNQEFKGKEHIYSYDLLFQEANIHFFVHVTVTLGESALSLEAKGTAHSSFLKNRIGFCVHLPARLRSTKCKVFHSDGSHRKSIFPELITPHQPFRHINSIEWQTTNSDVKLSFEGDIFEMEDQRNWTDASYKIYSTPLDKPFPVEVKAGETFFQKIILSVSKRQAFDRHIETNTESETLSFPLIGIPCPEDISSLSFFQTLPFSFFRIDVRFHQLEWKNVAYSQIQIAQSMCMKIDAVLYFGKNFECEANDFITWIKSLSFNVEFHAITLLSSQSFVLTDEQLRLLSGIFHSCFEGVLIGGGTDANFAQLNRNRPDVGCLDFICYSIHPQEHASDPLSVVENIQGQIDTVRTAQSFSAGKAIHIASLSLFRRFNANIAFISPSDTCPDYGYMGTDFEAGWFAGALHELISAGVKSIVCTARINKESSLANLFRLMATHRPEGFYNCGSSDPEKYSVLSWQSGERRCSIFANHTDKEILIVHPYAELKIKPYGWGVKIVCLSFVPQANNPSCKNLSM